MARTTSTPTTTTEVATPKASTPKTRGFSRIPSEAFFNISLDSVQMEKSRPTQDKAPEAVTVTILYDVEKTTEVSYVLNPAPSFNVKGVERFKELVFTRAVDMPHSFFAVAQVWTHTLNEFRKKEKGCGWVAIKISHDSDLLPILVRFGFIPTLADDGQTQIAIAFLAVNTDYIAKSEKVDIDLDANKIAVEGNFGRVELAGQEIKLHASSKVYGSNVNIEALGVEFHKLNVYNIQKEPVVGVPYYACYEVLARLMKSLSILLYQARSSRDPNTALGVIATNRLEAIACMEAGFFPVDYNGEGTLYIRTR